MRRCRMWTAADVPGAHHVSCLNACRQKVGLVAGNSFTKQFVDVADSVVAWSAWTK